MLKFALLLLMASSNVSTNVVLHALALHNLYISLLSFLALSKIQFTKSPAEWKILRLAHAIESRCMYRFSSYVTQSMIASISITSCLFSLYIAPTQISAGKLSLPCQKIESSLPKSTSVFPFWFNAYWVCLSIVDVH